MSRLDLITIAIVIVCLAALGYLVYKIVNLMNPPEVEQTAIQDSYSPSDPAEDEATYTDWDDEASSTANEVDLEDNDDSAAQEHEATAETTTENTKEEAVAEEKPSQSIKDDTPQKSASTYDSSNNTRISTSSGKYMILAGSYRQRNNADNQVAKLKKMGYSDTRVELFDKGSFAVVLVDRTNSYTTAQNLVAELKGKGIDAMIKAKN